MVRFISLQSLELAIIDKVGKSSIYLSTSVSKCLKIDNRSFYENLVKIANEQSLGWFFLHGNDTSIVNLSRVASYEYNDHKLMIEMMSGLTFDVDAPEETYKRFESCITHSNNGILI